MRDYGRIATTWWTRGHGRALRGDAPALAIALYLRSCPASSMIGLFYLPLVTIAHETGVALDEARAAIARLAALGCAHLDEEADLVWIPDLAWTEIGPALEPRDKRVAGIARALEQLGAHPFVDAFLARYGAAYHLEAPSKPLRSPLQGASAADCAPPEAPSKPGSGSDSDPEDLSLAPAGEDAGRGGDAPGVPTLARCVGCGAPDGMSHALGCSRPGYHPVTAPTLAALAETPGRADGGLLGTLARQADAGHPWCVTTAPRVLARGGRLTDPERARLREIGAEEAAPKARASPSPSSSRPSISLQPPAKPGEHTWKAGEEHTF
jgi:hypothetical protein